MNEFSNDFVIVLKLGSRICLTAEHTPRGSPFGVLAGGAQNLSSIGFVFRVFLNKAILSNSMCAHGVGVK